MKLVQAPSSKEIEIFLSPEKRPLASGLNPTTNAFDCVKACGTSLESASNLANKIALGQIDSAIAAGTDTSSDVPIELSDKLSQRLVQMTKSKTVIDRAKNFVPNLWRCYP